MSHGPALFPISIEGVWGYIDASGRVAIEPLFQDASRFSEGLARVTVAGESEEDRVFGKKYQGFIGPSGDFVIPPRPPVDVGKVKFYNGYSYSDFQDGLAAVRVHAIAQSWTGYIDRTGKLVLPVKYDSEDFSEGLAFAETSRRMFTRRWKKAGFIDKRGRFAIRNDAFSHSDGFQEGRAVVSVDSDDDDWAQALIDKQGKFIVLPGVYDSFESAVDGAIVVRKDRAYGMIDLDGQIIVPLGRYESILAPEDDAIFTAELRGNTVLLNASGEQLAEVAAPGHVLRFSGGMATIQQDEHYGYVDVTGALKIAPRFDYAEYFRNGLALATFGKSKGYIDITGKFVWQTDRWDEPLRYAVRSPLADFLPQSTIEALPFSHHWGSVQNAIVFAAEASLDEIRAAYRDRFPDDEQLRDHTDYDVEPDKIDLTISHGQCPFVELYAMDGMGEAEDVDAFVAFYCCKNMTALRQAHPDRIIGILIEN